MDGRIAEADRVDDEALIELDAGGVDGAAVEGVERTVLEVAPYGLGLVELSELRGRAC